MTPAMTVSLKLSQKPQEVRDMEIGNHSPNFMMELAKEY
jgi:hypothetical protein